MKIVFKIKYSIVVIIGLLFFSNAYSQQDDLIFKAKELIYSDPDEAIKIGQHILKNSQNPQQKVEANLILGESYLAKGDFDNAANSIFSEENEFAEENTNTRIAVFLLKSDLCRRLFLNKQAKKYFLKAQELAAQLAAEDLDETLQYYLALETIYSKLTNRDIAEVIGEIKTVQSEYKEFLNEHQPEKEKILMSQLRSYNDLGQLDSAFLYVDKLKASVTSPQNNNVYEKAIFFKELGNLQTQRKLFDSSEATLRRALGYAEVLSNATLQMQIIRDQSLNYLATNQKEKYKATIDRFLPLNNEVTLIEERATNTIYNLVTQQQEDLVAAKKDEYNQYLKFILIGLLSLIFIGLFKILRDYEKKKRLREILKYLEISKNQLKNLKVPTKPKTKRISIPEETEQSLLAKLKRFEASKKFLSKDMSLALLAGQFETNTKYLSEIINTHYNDNFNTFINRLRINYIIGKLKNDPNYINYKISFLAEDSGYSSHSSFATVFKSIVGMSPATFINLIRDEREEKLQDTEK